MSKRATRKTPGKPLTNYPNNLNKSFTEYRVFFHFSVSEPELLPRLKVAG